MRRTLITTVALLALAAAPASAKRNPYTPAQVCGAGYGVIDQHDVTTPGARLATTYLLYNGANGKNCVATMKRRAIGRRTWTSASLRKQGADRARVDSGYYRYYAGPKRWKARGVCVEWGGGARIGTLSSGFLTGFEHCGA